MPGVVFREEESTACQRAGGSRDVRVSSSSNGQGGERGEERAVRREGEGASISCLGFLCSVFCGGPGAGEGGTRPV